MLKVLLHFFGANCLAAIVTGAFAVAAYPAKEAAHSFKVGIASKLDMEIHGYLISAPLSPTEGLADRVPSSRLPPCL